MVLVGMLNYRKHPDEVKKAFACAAVAKMMDIDFVFFTAGNVNFEKQTINGYVYEKGSWINKEVGFPDVIYNATSGRTANQRKVYRKLKKIIPFTSHPIGNKMKVYRRIEKIPEFRHYLIPSKKIFNAQDVLDAIMEYKKVVVKPLSGNRGDNILFIEQIGEQYEFVDGADHELVDGEKLIERISIAITNKTLLVQPYISCRTIDGFPYDFRIHVQKGGTGEWGITLIYPRIGSKDGIISNVSKGGFIAKLESFLDREFGREGFDIQRTLEQFAIRFSEKFADMYKQPLDELGIDIGIDSDKKLWIYEVNWRPGYVYRELDAAMRLIPYAVYLAGNSMQVDSDQSEEGTGII